MGDTLMIKEAERMNNMPKSATAAGLGDSELGVLDLEKGTFTAFSREGYNARYEWSLGWFDDDRVEIWSGQWSAEAVYIYRF